MRRSYSLVAISDLGETLASYTTGAYGIQREVERLVSGIKPGERITVVLTLKP